MIVVGCGGGGEGKVEIFRVEENGSFLESKIQLVAHTSNCYCVKVDKSGRYLASGESGFEVENVLMFDD